METCANSLFGGFFIQVDGNKTEDHIWQPGRYIWIQVTLSRKYSGEPVCQDKNCTNHNSHGEVSPTTAPDFPAGKDGSDQGQNNNRHRGCGSMRPFHKEFLNGLGTTKLFHGNHPVQFGRSEPRFYIFIPLKLFWFWGWGAPIFNFVPAEDLLV